MKGCVEILVEGWVNGRNKRSDRGRSRGMN